MVGGFGTLVGGTKNSPYVCVDDCVFVCALECVSVLCVHVQWWVWNTMVHIQYPRLCVRVCVCVCKHVRVCRSPADLCLMLSLQLQEGTAPFHHAPQSCHFAAKGNSSGRKSIL